MKLTLSQQNQQSKTNNLFGRISTSIAVHCIAAAFLIFLVSNTVFTEYLYRWSALLVCSLLLSTLVLTMFGRSRVALELTARKWENIYAYSTALVSIVFSTAYCYIALLGDALLWASLSLIMVMHLSCMLVPCFSSKKVMLSSALPLTLPFIGILVMASEPSAYVFAASITIYTCVIFIVGFDLHKTLIRGFEMECKYNREVKVSKGFKENFENLTFEDPETQIYNRRFFDLMVDEEIRRAKRADKSLTIAIIEIDCFADYLEKYGHENSSKCLQSVARILSDTTSRGGEFMTRFDTNKFALIAPDLNAKEAVTFASKINMCIHTANIEHFNTPVENAKNVSISIGITEFTPGKIIDVDELIRQGESALLAARNAGGNNTQVYATNIVPVNSSMESSAHTISHKPMLVINNSNTA